VVFSSCAMSEWRDIRAARHGCSKLTNASPAYVVFRHALSGIASWRDPRVPCMHAFSLVALTLTCLVLSRLSSSVGVVATSVAGSLLALLPLRALLDLASNRTKEDCPMLISCPGYRVVENYEVCFATATLYVASMAACAFGRGWFDQYETGVMKASGFVSLLFIAFFLCRTVRVSRGIESSVLCFFGAIGVAMECV